MLRDRPGLLFTVLFPLLFGLFFERSTPTARPANGVHWPSP